MVDIYLNEPGLTKLEDDIKPDPVEIRFSGSSAKLDQVGKIIEDGISISPAIKGQWMWIDDTLLRFSPEEDWSIGQEYTVTMSKTLFPDHIHLEDYKYPFKTKDFSLSITESEFYQDPANPKIRRVVATVKFTHPVDTADFEKRIRLSMKGEKKGFMGLGEESFPFTVSYDKYYGEAYIHSAPVKIPEKESSMLIEIDDGVRSSRGGTPAKDPLSINVNIPGMYTFFRIKNVETTFVRNEAYEQEHVLVIETTAGALAEEIINNMSVYVLPKDKPAVPGQQGQKDYYWSDVRMIGPEVLSFASLLEIEPLPTETEYSMLHSYRYKATAGSFLYVKLKKGIRSFGDFILAKEFDKIIRVPEYPKELKIMHDGAILSMSGDKKISIMSRYVEAIKFEVARVLPGQINHLISQSGGQFNNPYFSNYRFGQDNITEVFSDTRSLSDPKSGKVQYSSFDFSQYVNKGGAGSERGLFFFKVQGWDPFYKRTIGVSDKRLILITDLGILIKEDADGNRDVFVQSFYSGEPVSGAKVEVIGKNGLPLVSRTTDGNGHVTFPLLKNLAREKEPTVLIARKGNDVSFIPYERRDRQLNFSRFDIGGVRAMSTHEKLSAFLFSDRGIYRPGDTFNVGLIVKSGDWSRTLSGVPLEIVVTDPRGLVVKKQNLRLGQEGFEEVRHATEESSPTGNYRISAYIVRDNRRGGLLGSTEVRVEEFLPDRLSITTHLSKERLNGWIAPEMIKGKVVLKNLFGTPARNRRVAGSISLMPSSISFKAYRDYIFTDPLRAERSFSEDLIDRRTDEKGEAEFDLDLDRFERATYRLRFVAEGYEAEGGRGVVSESTVIVSPLEYLVGYKPDGDLRYINKGSDRNIDLIAVDPVLNRTDVNDLDMQLREIRYVSVLMKQPNGTYKYESVQKEIDVKKERISIPVKGLTYPLPSGQPGDYALIVKDSEGNELSRITFSVIGQANLTRSLEKNAELQVKLNKNDFRQGETVEIYIKAPYKGAGLITIERERVYAYKWFRAGTTSFTEKIRIPEDLEGNGYINVAFVRAPDSSEIFMSPLSYGIAPFSVSKGKRMIDINLESAELSQPGEPYTIRYSSNKSGKIVVFAVDEGILQVAKYKVPDPLAHFFKKRALEVETAQILDLLLPEFELLKNLAAPGGDEDYEKEALGKNLNPFKQKRKKPVAYWSGIVDVDKTERKLVYQVPDHFNGTLRVMAVAVAPDAVGVIEKKSFIRGHFVLTPNVPTFVAPGDAFTISLGVANNVEGSGKDPVVNVSVDTSEHLSVLDDLHRQVKIGEGDETSEIFRVRANDKLGSGRFTFVAAMGSKKTRYTVDLSVRPPVPYRTTVKGGFIKSDTVDVPVERKMYPEFRKLEVGASVLPLGIAHGLVSYLRKFPYGCTEQIVSQAFPAIVLKNRPEFGYAPEEVEENLSRVIRILRARQNAEGAFGFWAANSHYSEFQTVYATHFLTEAQEKGYSVPDDLLERSLAFLKVLASKENETLAQERVKAYAIYVLTRNGEVTTSYVNALHESLEKNLKKTWQKDLTGIYVASIYKMLRLEGKADSLIARSNMGDSQETDYENFYDGLIRDAQYLYILSRDFPERLEELEGEDILHIVTPVMHGSFNTTSSAYAILALDAYASSRGIPKPKDLKLSEVLKDKKTRNLVLPKSMFPVIGFSQDAEAIRISNKEDTLIFYNATMAGFNLSLPDSSLKQKLEIQREYHNKKGEVVKEAALGSEIEVHIKVRSIDADHISNIAIVDLLPGGFEVVMDSVRGIEGGSRFASPAVAGQSTLGPDYVDVREDRVVLFGRAAQNVKEFIYRIKAINKGEFKVPPVFGESMYDRTVQALSLGDMITVGDPE